MNTLYQKCNRLILFMLLYAIYNIAVAQFIELSRKTVKGLKTNYIEDIAVDKNGYFWISTGKEIYRFNGISLETIGENHQVNKLSNIESNIFGDTFFYDTSKIIKYDGNQFFEIFNFSNIYDHTGKLDRCRIFPSPYSNAIAVSLKSEKSDTSFYVLLIDDKGYHLNDISEYTFTDMYDPYISFDKAGYLWIRIGMTRHVVNGIEKAYSNALLSINSSGDIHDYSSFEIYGNVITEINFLGDRKYVFGHSYSGKNGYVGRYGLLKENSVAQDQISSYLNNSKLIQAVRFENDNLYVFSGDEKIDRIRHYLKNGRYSETYLSNPINAKRTNFLLKGNQIYAIERYNGFQKLYKLQNNSFIPLSTIQHDGWIRNIRNSKYFMANSGSDHRYISLIDLSFFDDIKLSTLNRDIGKVLTTNENEFFIVFIEKDNPKSDIWEASGLGHFFNNKFELLSTETGLSSNIVEDMYLDSNDRLWILYDTCVAIGSRNNNGWDFSEISLDNKIAAFNSIEEVGKEYVWLWNNTPNDYLKKNKYDDISKYYVISYFDGEVLNPIHIPDKISNSSNILKYLKLVYSEKNLSFFNFEMKDTLFTYYYNISTNQWHNYDGIYPIGYDRKNSYWMSPKGKSIYTIIGQDTNLIYDHLDFEYSPKAVYSSPYGVILYSPKSFYDNFITILSGGRILKHDINGFMYGIRRSGNGVRILYFDQDDHFFDGNTLISIEYDKDFFVIDSTKLVYITHNTDNESEIYLKETDCLFPTIDIVGVNFNGNYTSEKRSYSTEYESNSFSIYLSSKDYENPGSIYFRHFLEGYEKEWSEFSHENKVDYINVDYGNYKFKAQCYNVYGHLSNIEEIDIKILPPWYRTWWFYTLEGLLALGLVGLVLAGQRRGLKRKADDKLSQLELKRQQDELEYARSVQLSMLPKEDIKLPNLEITGFMQTATEVGGDYYDFFQIDDKHYTVALGDATGHGVGAGLMVGMVKSALTQSLKRFKPGEDSLIGLMATMNDTLREALTQRGLGMCLSLSIINAETGELEVSSSGLPYPYHYKNPEKELIPVVLESPPLGLIKNASFSHARLTLQPGDLFICTSDGLPERMRHDDAIWGYENMEKLIDEVCHRTLPPQEIIKYVFDKCDLFAGGRPNDDDMTMVVVKKS